MAFICVFFPAVVMCAVRRKLLKGIGQRNGTDWRQVVFEYVSCCLFLNLLLFASLALFWQITQDVYGMLGSDSIFAMKYLLSSIFFAVAVPFLERYVREHVSISLEMGEDRSSRNPSAVSRWISRYGLYALGIVAIGIHFVRIFDNVFWYDEALPLITQSMGIRGMLHQVAAWGHVPLHYGIILVLYRMFGSHGAMYHFVSLFPYIVIVIVTVTIVRKWFGKRTAAILILLSSLLANAVQYNVEVRMYSWCQMFIFIAYLMMYQILRMKKARYFVLMSIFSLGALYSHYFAVAAIGMLYLFLLAYAVWKDKTSIWKVVCSGGMTAMLFLPWMLYGHHVRGQFVARYGNLRDVSWRTCFEYVFSSKHSLFLLLMFFCIFIWIFLRESGILRVQDAGNSKKQAHVVMNHKDWAFSYEAAWMLAGVFATFGTIAAAEWFSHMFYPIITLRYFYPALILVWLVFGICISKCKNKKLISLALSAILVFSCVPAYLNTVKSEHEIEKGMESTLVSTDEILQWGGYIMTNVDAVNWPMLLYYYPKSSHDYFEGTALPEFHEGETNWLFLGDAMTEEIAKCLQDRGHSAELIVPNGYVGSYRIWVYKIVE